jgi:hypothetical protein
MGEYDTVYAALPIIIRVFNILDCVCIVFKLDSELLIIFIGYLM